MKKRHLLILETYSVKIIKEKYIELYSELNPATNSDSASDKSKGTLFDSAKKEIKENNNQRKLKQRMNGGNEETEGNGNERCR